MKPTNICLSESEISKILSNDVLASEAASLEQHIADCEACRAKIESMIADPKWWNEAQQSLAASSTRGCAETEASHEGELATTEQMLSLLGPTDDPEKMGRIAEYEVIGIIGRGGMGVVFKAFDPRLNRFVAIKMLLPHLASFGAARKRFAREGQAAAAVVNDYVLPIYAVAEWRGVPYLVCQYSRGTTLQTRVQSEGPLELEEILRLGMQTARGLAAAHSQGLVHRDVKPSNILLDGSVERALLTDFGLARAVDDASITRTGMIAGTPQYMSPEQARGGSVDARSDLFSLGCVLYFLCTGHPPFRADNSYAILRLITDEEPRSIREINPAIPDWLCSVVQKLMAKKPEDRYASASELAEQLEACLAHVSNPLKNSLPAIAPRTLGIFQRSSIMNDTRTLSFVSFGLFIAALVLPWPIAAIGPDEYAIIFSGVSILLALMLAVVSRRELFSRLVLVGAAISLLPLMVALIVFVLSFQQVDPAAEVERMRELTAPSQRSFSSVSAEDIAEYEAMSKDPQYSLMKLLAEDRDKAEALIRAGQKQRPGAHLWAIDVQTLFAADQFTAKSLLGEKRVAHFKHALEYLQESYEITVESLKKAPSEQLQEVLPDLQLDLALAALEAGETELAKKHAAETLQKNTDETSDHYGNVIHNANQILGRCALREGNLADAKAYLLKAGATPGSPQLNSFGPQLHLARELLEKGEKETVLQYLDLVSKFWASDNEESALGKQISEERAALIAGWKREIAEGKIPIGAQWL
jgi:serine/threonine protein kinase